MKPVPDALVEAAILHTLSLAAGDGEPLLVNYIVNCLAPRDQDPTGEYAESVKEHIGRLVFDGTLQIRNGGVMMVPPKRETRCNELQLTLRIAH